MRVLYVTKTADGAAWAALQAVELSRMGVEVHVAAPRSQGRMMGTWREAGAQVHLVDINPRRPLRLRAEVRKLARLVQELRPDLIHSYFVSTTVALRIGLGKNHPIPRIFQVVGPLHLEHALYRRAELASAGPNDHWIGTSQYIVDLYRAAGIAPSRLFMSYLGTRLPATGVRRGHLRREYGIPNDAIVVGNSNYMYAPKFYLGQTVGLKCHEDVIDALGEVTARDRRVVGLIVGGPWNGAHRYERRLRERARARAGDRIIMTGFLEPDRFAGTWNEFDLVVHVPLSENCGGVHEPLLHGTPVIASRVGGIPELVIDGITGCLVPPRQPQRLAEAIERTIADLDAARALAARGKELVSTMFDIRRTAQEVMGVYGHVLEHGPRPTAFDSRAYAASLSPSVTAEQVLN